MAEIPHLPQLQKKYPDQLVAISWNLDHDDADNPPSESLQESVLEKLKELEIDVENVISSDPIGSVLEHHGIFALPAVLVYDRDGQLQKFEGAFTYEKDVIPLVDKLVQ